MAFLPPSSRRDALQPAARPRRDARGPCRRCPVKLMTSMSGFSTSAIADLVAGTGDHVDDAGWEARPRAMQLDEQRRTMGRVTAPA